MSVVFSIGLGPFSLLVTIFLDVDSTKTFLGAELFAMDTLH
jgi:hypothetical protein